MAAASSVVELCTLADAAGLDAATSAKFFRDDDDGAGGAIISCFAWPEAGRTPSRLSQSALQVLCEKYKVPAEYTTMSLDGRWAACQTPPESSHAIFVYADALQAGMRIPLHDFYVEVLGHYGLAPSQLAPDAWRYMAAFVLLSQDAGVEPALPAFRSFFSICARKGDSAGWHHFRSRPGRCLFNGRMPRSPDPDEWKSRFFLLRSPATRPWPCPVKWGKPSRAAVRMPAVTGDTDMVMRKLMDRAGSSGGIDVVQFLSRRSLPVAPLQAAPPAQKKDKLVKVGAAGAAAGPAPAPAPPPHGGATPKRKSFSDTRTRGLVECIAESSELAKKAMEELDEKGKELLAARAEVAKLKEALSVANAHRAAEVRRLADEASNARVEEVKAECASVVAKLQEEHAAAVSQLAQHLKKQRAAAVARLMEEQAAGVDRLEGEHAAAVTRLEEKHAAEVGRVADEHRKAAVLATEHHKAEVAKLQEEHAAAVARLREDHATSVNKLKEEHAADVARVKEAADKEVQDIKKNIVLRLFPKLDVSLLERPKLKRDPGAARTPKAEGRS